MSGSVDDMMDESIDKMRNSNIGTLKGQRETRKGKGSGSREVIHC